MVTEITARGATYRQMPLYGFWRQLNPKPYSYTPQYTSRQSTTLQMAKLRMDTLIQYTGTFRWKEMSACDVGCGTGVFADYAARFFRTMSKYDVSGESIPHAALEQTDWGILFLTDVLEHFEDIEDLLKLKYKYVFLSFPETPQFTSEFTPDMWRHYKPDEHIWMLNRKGVMQWLEDTGHFIVCSGYPEDKIRSPQPELRANIATVIAERV